MSVTLNPSSTHLWPRHYHARNIPPRIYSIRVHSSSLHFHTPSFFCLPTLSYQSTLERTKTERNSSEQLRHKIGGGGLPSLFRLLISRTSEFKHFRTRSGQRALPRPPGRPSLTLRREEFKGALLFHVRADDAAVWDLFHLL